MVRPQCERHTPAAAQAGQPLLPMVPAAPLRWCAYPSYTDRVPVMDGGAEVGKVYGMMNTKHSMSSPTSAAPFPIAWRPPSSVRRFGAALSKQLGRSIGPTAFGVVTSAASQRDRTSGPGQQHGFGDVVIHTADRHAAGPQQAAVIAMMGVRWVIPSRRGSQPWPGSHSRRQLAVQSARAHNALAPPGQQPAAIARNIGAISEPGEDGDGPPPG